jgi:hypothetical protein
MTSIAAQPTHRDDRETPLLWAKDGATHAPDLPDVTSGIFLREGLDIDSVNQNLTCPGSAKATPGGGRRVDLSHLVVSNLQQLSLRGALATKQSIYPRAVTWIASLRSQ